MKRRNKPQSVQGISAKNMEDVSMYSDGGKQTATASGTIKRILQDSTGKKLAEPKYIWDSWFNTKTKKVIASIIAILIFLATILPLKDLVLQIFNNSHNPTSAAATQKKK